MNYSLYIHITPNNKKYIGITRRNPEDRWNNGNGYRNNNHFYCAIKKYGWNNIQHIVILTGLSKEEAEKKEIEYIAKYNTTDRRYGYNNDYGGGVCAIPSPETIKKMKLSHIGKRPYIHKTNEEKEKHRIRTTNRWKDKKERKKLTDSIREKHGIKVICVETKQVFDTIIDASNFYNITAINIGRCCRGKRMTAGGYHWKKYEVMLND